MYCESSNGVEVAMVGAPEPCSRCAQVRSARSPKKEARAGRARAGGVGRCDMRTDRARTPGREGGATRAGWPSSSTSHNEIIRVHGNVQAKLTRKFSKDAFAAYTRDATGAARRCHCDPTSYVDPQPVHLA